MSQGNPVLANSERKQTMTTETTRYDVLVCDAQPNSKLAKIGTAYPTKKGAGFRFTLNRRLSSGWQVILLPSRWHREKLTADDIAPATNSETRG